MPFSIKFATSATRSSASSMGSEETLSAPLSESVQRIASSAAQKRKARESVVVLHSRLAVCNALVKEATSVKGDVIMVDARSINFLADR